jgi:hypothetical protein
VLAGIFIVSMVLKVYAVPILDKLLFIRIINVNISKLNTDLTWKLLANVTGNTAVDLPSTFKEIHIRVYMPAAGLYVENNFLYQDFNTQTTRYLHSIGGWYYTGTNNGWCTLADVGGQIYLNSAFYGGTNITSECQFKVYYR